MFYITRIFWKNFKNEVVKVVLSSMQAKYEWTTGQDGQQKDFIDDPLNEVLQPKIQLPIEFTPI